MGEPTEYFDFALMGGEGTGSKHFDCHIRFIGMSLTFCSTDGCHPSESTLLLGVWSRVCRYGDSSVEIVNPAFEETAALSGLH